MATKLRHSRHPNGSGDGKSPSGVTSRQVRKENPRRSHGGAKRRAKAKASWANYRDSRNFPGQARMAHKRGRARPNAAANTVSGGATKAT